MVIQYNRKTGPGIYKTGAGYIYIGPKKVPEPQRGGVKFDPPIIVCACCSMQTSPGDSENLQGDLLPHKIKSKCCTQNGFGGTSTPPPHLQAVQEPIFLWLLHILAMGVVAVSGIFWPPVVILNIRTLPIV